MLSKVLANSKYSFEVGQGTKMNYTFAFLAIEMDRFPLQVVSEFDYLLSFFYYSFQLASNLP